MSTVSDRRRRDTHRKQIDELAVALRRLGGSLLLHHQGEAEKLGLNPTDSRAMSFLAETGPIPAGRLAELMSLTTGAITGLLDRLEAAGLVQRESDPDDRRRVLVVPTEASDAQDVQRLFGPLARPFATLVRSYSEDELALILEFVNSTSELLRSEVEIRVLGRNGDGGSEDDAAGHEEEEADEHGGADEHGAAGEHGGAGDDV